MSGNDSAVNWEAYSHSELHQMLWQNADVGSVSKLADEWTAHRAALATHAEVLREQRAALLADWQGVAAEEAAARLGALADRIEKISELAGAGQRAAQDAADALAAARAAMPPPPPAPLGDATAAAAAGEALPGFGPGLTAFAPPPRPGGPPALTFGTAPAGFSLPSAPQLPQGGGTGISFFFTVGSADQQKAQAVRAMQTYESSLNGGSRLIDDARGAVPQATTTATAPTPTTATTAPVPPRASQKPAAGVPWQRLTGGGGGGGGAVRAGVASAPVPAVASGPAQLSPGMRAGVVLGVTGGPTTFASPAGDTAARGAAQNGAMAPPAAGARGDDEQEHQNQMPTLDHGLFELDERACPPVIGVEA